MLTLVEKILFTFAVFLSAYSALRVAERIIRILRRGQGKPDWRLAGERLAEILAKTITLQPTFRLRIAPSLFHALIAWGFIYYLLVNLGDTLEGFIPDYQFLGSGAVGSLYRFLADLLSVGVLIGMLVMLFRRFILKTSALTTRQDVLLHPKARSGIRRDSAIVGGFILLHVGSRFLGESIHIAKFGPDIYQPFASVVSNLWAGASQSALTIGEHLAYWLALGTILAFIPYFLYSKHIHLFFAPLNFLLKPQRRSIGELGRVNFDDESVDQFGANRLEDLGWEQLMDAYACIMCYRCQEVCPAYNTGKVLSPAAMEINKRYFLNQEGSRMADGQPSSQSLTGFAIPEEAVWACTACGACVDICPVGNEPMRDIMDIRRALVLMDNNFPDQLQTAFRGMERTTNPWNISPADRMKWAEGLRVPTIEQNPQPDILWWVGCAPATDPRAQVTAQAFARILNKSGVSYAVLGTNEQCTGDSARRAGNEFLFNELASANVEILNGLAPKRIVTTCPHCLHTLKNEYQAYGGQYTVVHHTQLINELIVAKKIRLKVPIEIDISSELQNEDLLIKRKSKIHDPKSKITFHDPCYLGRQNGIVIEPRQTLRLVDVKIAEMPRHGAKSFCCGAGGAQMWKEEEAGIERVSANRFAEAQRTGAETLAVGCPFCMIMLTDAQKAADSPMQVRDIAEIVADQLDMDDLL
ncbi:MAG: [Fe-S]-binding protein [Chloroflexi bacterium RBG_16_54_18]|nr:MAG: [Fe-S]-binding protein [Chloroflexi bacterium RBG_16_54_18]